MTIGDAVCPFGSRILGSHVNLQPFPLKVHVVRSRRELPKVLPRDHGTWDQFFSGGKETHPKCHGKRLCLKEFP